MSFISSRNSFGETFTLTGNIDLYVTDLGSDSNGARTESSGNLSSKPFLTINGALAYLPTDRSLSGYAATIHYTRSVSQSVTAAGFKNGSLILDSTILNTSSFVSCENLSLTNIEAVGQLTINDSTSAVNGNVHDDGCLLFNGGRTNVQISADDCSSTALKAQYMSYVGYSAVANGCLATPVDFTAVQYSELVGVGLSGTNPAATRGVRLAAGGKHVLTGSTITSENDWVLDIDGYTLKWVDLSTENYTNSSTYAFWSDNLWVMLGRFRVLNNSSQDFDDFVVRDLQYGRFFKQYGLDRPLDPAYKEITASITSTQGSATQCALQDTVITTAAVAGASARLLADSDVSGMGGGCNGSVWNRTANYVALFPPTDKTLYINGVSLGSNVSTTLSAGAFINWLCDNAGNFSIG